MLCRLPRERIPLGTESHDLPAVRAEENESPAYPERSARLACIDLRNLSFAVRANRHQIFTSHDSTRHLHGLSAHFYLLNCRFPATSCSQPRARGGRVSRPQAAHANAIDDLCLVGGTRVVIPGDNVSGTETSPNLEAGVGAPVQPAMPTRRPTGAIGLDASGAKQPPEPAPRPPVDDHATVRRDREQSHQPPNR